jgi:hypothetical protein
MVSYRIEPSCSSNCHAVINSPCKARLHDKTSFIAGTHCKLVPARTPETLRTAILGVSLFHKHLLSNDPHPLDIINGYLMAESLTQSSSNSSNRVKIHRLPILNTCNRPRSQTRASSQLRDRPDQFYPIFFKSHSLHLLMHRMIQLYHGMHVMSILLHTNIWKDSLIANLLPFQPLLYTSISCRARPQANSNYLYTKTCPKKQANG